jgi:hypothetical protein
MVRADRKTKLSQRKVGREMKRFAHTREPPVVIPIVVVAVDVDVPLIVPAIEGGERCVQNVAHSTAPRVLLGLYRIRHLKCHNILHQVSSLLKVPAHALINVGRSTYITLSKAVATDILDCMDTGLGGKKP